MASGCNSEEIYDAFNSKMYDTDKLEQQTLIMDDDVTNNERFLSADSI